MLTILTTSPLLHQMVNSDFRQDGAYITTCTLEFSPPVTVEVKGLAKNSKDIKSRSPQGNQSSLHPYKLTKRHQFLKARVQQNPV